MLERSFAKKIYFVECQKYFGIVPCRLPYGWVNATESRINNKSSLTLYRSSSIHHKRSVATPTIYYFRTAAILIYNYDCFLNWVLSLAILIFGTIENKRETLSAINAGCYSVRDFADTYYTKTPASLKFERVRQNFDKWKYPSRIRLASVSTDF